ncbi:MAG: group II intron reverse transcriptase/maturase [Gammaproteobacteria bacterium]|nr:group II intron reverse transcriptase/maturase [Gammaproteobacteria bacterium]MCP5137457.1 group II intron reverse transcriptase/maturase [Gammaproteobacteria bacterium]
MRILEKVPATSHRVTHWHAINWRQMNHQVRGLQVRIAKATKEEQWRRVHSLQRLLVRSFAAKALAVRRVTENRGKKTPGVDGEIWDTPGTKWEAISRLERTGYKPKPLRRVYIAKKNGSRRALGIPTMLDRAMQALYLLALEPVSETTADRNSYGFRPQRSTADAMEQCFVALSRKHSAKWVLEGDIKGCFDNISHDWLINHVHLDKVMLEKWLKVGFMESSHWNPTEAGTPQGGIISPVLANLALDGLEKVLFDRFGHKNTKKSYKTKVNYVRYADDFVVTGISQEILENEVKPVVDAFMAERGLALAPEKTRITHIDEGFDFLGQNVRRYGEKLLIKPAHSNLKSFLAKVRDVIRRHRAVPASVLIANLNPVIRGWANYHRHVVSAETFKYVDYRIWKLLWKWARRRHQNRHKRWVKEKYFARFGSRSWVFHGIGSAGQLSKLVYASDIPIKRHTKIKSEANLFDPEYELYFESRLERLWRDSCDGRRRILGLWLAQNKRCLVCAAPITKQTGWHVHHLFERFKGGGNESQNLVLLHPSCHTQLHNQGLRVSKPVLV